MLLFLCEILPFPASPQPRSLYCHQWLVASHSPLSEVLGEENPLSWRGSIWGLTDPNFCADPKNPFLCSPPWSQSISYRPGEVQNFFRGVFGTREEEEEVDETWSLRPSNLCYKWQLQDLCVPWSTQNSSQPFFFFNWKIDSMVYPKRFLSKGVNSSHFELAKNI